MVIQNTLHPLFAHKIIVTQYRILSLVRRIFKTQINKLQLGSRLISEILVKINKKFQNIEFTGLMLAKLDTCQLF